MKLPEVITRLKILKININIVIWFSPFKLIENKMLLKKREKETVRKSHLANIIMTRYQNRIYYGFIFLNKSFFQMYQNY